MPPIAIAAPLLITAAALGLAGCDPIYGITRSAQLDALPSLECVASVIRKTPDVTALTVLQTGPNGVVPWTGIQQPQGTYYFLFKGADGSQINGTIYLSMDRHGHRTFSAGNSRLNSRPPQAEIDATRPVFHQIELRLAAQCGLATLATDIREECYGVKCKSLVD